MAIRAGIESPSQALFFALLVGLLGQGGYAARPGDGEDSEKVATPAADIGGSSFLQEADIYRGFGAGDDIYDSMQEKSAHLEEALARTRDQVRRVRTAVKHDELVISDLKEKISEAETLLKASNAEEAELRRGRAHAQLEMFATIARASASSKDILNGKADVGAAEDVGAAVDVGAAQQAPGANILQDVVPDDKALQPNLGDDALQSVVVAANENSNDVVPDGNDNPDSLVEHEQQQKKEQGGDDKSTHEDATALQAGGESAIQVAASSEGTQQESKAEQKDASHGKSAEAHKGASKKHRQAKHGSKKHHQHPHSEALETEGAQ